MLDPTRLPAHLAERTRVLGNAQARNSEFVLYWMHHAVRGHENPALDVALYLAHWLNKPLLVYQGLAGRHRYNADRHHRFIIEGARDAAEEMAARGVRHVLHVPQEPDLPSPLHGLLARSAVLVVEDFPAPPFPRWTRAWAQRSPGPVWAVDAFCLMPMGLIQQRPTRAFEFRRQAEAAWKARIATAWPEDAPQVERWDGDPGFEPLAPDADIEQCIAHCAIDHGIAPVADTPGGSRAGYQRWAEFCAHGLREYAALRNDAAIRPPLGVSRLSAYLHHGHVSPFRIAREADALGGPGARKYLDELLVWRELAFNFCRHTDQPESLRALPEWALDSLRQTASQERDIAGDREGRERARSGAALWDLAQTSLLRHGELHNNLRMTWGKSITLWNPDPAQALRELIDLNHRYALDGSNPNSYGGLLWCLGQFDRPFSPPAPITGVLRARSVDAHARRVDMAALSQHLQRGNARHLRLAVVGAGLAGSSAARTLQDHGHHVQLFDKARGAGGRASTRRSADWCFDHGAQYFTVRDRRFRRWTRHWQESGLLQPWEPRIRVFGEGPQRGEGHATERLVAVPGMNALVKHLQQDLQAHYGCRVVAVEHGPSGYHLHAEDGRQFGPFERVLLALPPAQAADLLTADSALQVRLRAVQMQPCWALMLGYQQALDLDFDAAFINQGPLRWLARNDSKPGRGGAPAWIAHASPEWSAQHLEARAEQVSSDLLQALQALSDKPLPVASLVQAHRWRYALGSTEETSKGYMQTDGGHLLVTGDWCHGARIEGAFLAGQAAAGALLRAAATCD